MLISKTVKVKVVPVTINYYKSLGYECKIFKYIEISIEHLKLGSETKVEVKCEGGCGKHFYIRYNSYIKALSTNSLFHDYCCLHCFDKIRNNSASNPMFNKETCKKAVINSTKAIKNKYGVEHISEIPGNELKKRETCLKNFGVEHPSRSSEIKQKKKDTLLKNYGVETIQEIPGIKERMRKTKEIRGILVPLELMRPYEIYKMDCSRYTKRVKKELFAKWNGLDFYDGEYIKDNVKLHSTHKRYPSIDHKISVLYGFLNGIPAEEICKLENLCITKRSLNSTKGKKGEEEFKKILALEAA